MRAIADPEDCFVGIDLGTSGCRAVAIDGSGGEQARASVRLPESHRREGGVSEQDPDDWWQAVLATLRDLTPSLKEYRVRGLAVDGTSSTLVLCGGHGEVLEPAMMYDDTRGIDELSRINDVAEATSAVHSASSSLAKLLHRLDQGGLPPGFKAVHQADWIAGRMTGRFDISDDNNCLKLGYDPVTNRWPGWLGRLGVPTTCLPHVVRPGTRIGVLTDAPARNTGLPAGISVFAGTTDSTASCIAAGASRVGDAVTVLGSTLVVKVLSEKPVTATQFGVYSQRYGDYWMAGGASNSGGSVLKAYFTPEQMLELGRGIEPERPGGLDYYPLLRPGERFPVNDASLAPMLSPRPDDDVLFFQGLLEGIARIERQGYRLLERLGAPWPERVRTIGGGASNEVWRRIRSRVLGIPVQNAEHEQAAHGAALLARRGYYGH